MEGYQHIRKNKLCKQLYNRTIVYIILSCLVTAIDLHRVSPLSTERKISHTLKVACLIILLLLSIHYLGMVDSANEQETKDVTVKNMKSESSRQNYDTDDVKAAIERGLQYLKDSQSAVGGWDDGGYYGMNSNTVANSLRAFLGYNATDPRWQDTIERAIGFLESVWHDPLDHAPGRDRDFYGGALWNDRINPQGYTAGKMYSQGAATAALIDYYFHTQNISFLPYINESVKLIVRSQGSPNRPYSLCGPRSDGGWRYDPAFTSSDTSNSGWNLHALALAESSGIHDIPDNCFEYFEKWLERVFSGSGFGYSTPSTRDANTAIGLYCLYLMGRGDINMAQKAKQTILNWGPAYAISKHYYTYHATLAMYLAGGDEWKEWNRGVREGLLDSQYNDGSWSGEYGMCWGTGMALMTLNLCLDPPFQASLEMQEDPNTGTAEETVKHVEPENTVSFNMSVSFKPQILEEPIPKSADERSRVFINVSKPTKGWTVVLDTPARDDGIKQPDGKILWWIDIALFKTEPLTINVTAPRIGEWNETCSFTIHASLEQDNITEQNELTICVILDQTIDFSISVPGEIDEFLGVKAFTINPGETIQVPVSINNLGNLNDTYHIWIKKFDKWNIQFDDGKTDRYISLSSYRHNDNRASVNIIIVTITAPDSVSEGKTKNITIFGESQFSGEIGIGTIERTEMMSLVVLEAPLELICSDPNKLVRPGSSIDFVIEVRNNFHSDLMVNLSVYWTVMMVSSTEKHENFWSCGFLLDHFVVAVYERKEITFRVNVPNNANTGSFREMYLQGTSYHQPILEYVTNPLIIRTKVNSPPEVTLSSPMENEIIMETDVSLSWLCKDPDDAMEDIGYDLYFGEHPQPELIRANIRERFITMDGLKDGTTYYWTVIPQDPFGVGICENGEHSFEVNSSIILIRTTLISPENNSMLGTFKVNLSWSGADPREETNVLFYHVYLATSPENLSIFAITTDQWIEVSHLEHNRTYYWKIIPVGNRGEGIYPSETWSFRINQSGIRQFRISSDAKKVIMPPGETAIFNITIRNYIPVPLTIYFSRSGNFSGYLDLPRKIEVETSYWRTIKVSMIIPEYLPIGNYSVTIRANNSMHSELMTLPVQVVDVTTEVIENGEEINEEEIIEDKGQEASGIYFLPSILIIIIFCMYLAFRRRGKNWWINRSRRLRVEVEYVPDHSKTKHPITTKDWGDIKAKAPIRTGEKTKRRVIRVRVVRRGRRLKVKDNNTMNFI